VTAVLVLGAAGSLALAAYEAAHRRWYYAAVQVAPWLPLAVALAIGD
jgi:hypothetical protein